MCESTVFVQKQGNEKLLAEDVARIVPEGDQVRVVTMLGDEHTIKGEIIDIDLMSHKILLKEHSE